MNTLYPKYKPLIFIVDDTEENVSFLGTILQEHNFRVEALMDSRFVMDFLERITPDIILLDYMMPFIDGIDVCKQIKAQPKLKNIPIIFVTARNDEDSIIKALEAGAVDFISKPFSSKELLARIKIHLDLKFSNQLIQIKMKEITEINQRLEKSKEETERFYRILKNEIDSASDYVHSLLPSKVSNDQRLGFDWYFEPSHNLGGDSFGYHWVDEDNFAVYLLDVSGHGVASALESVSVLNMLRFGTLSNVDFTEPAQVLTELNRAFPLQYHNFLFFTIFYAVYNFRTKTLKYSGAGHPPSFIFSKDNTRILDSQNILIGAKDNVKYISSSIHLPVPFKLFVYSDGLIDPHTYNPFSWDESNLFSLVQSHLSSPNLLFSLIDSLKTIRISDSFNDDIAILNIDFYGSTF